MYEISHSQPFDAHQPEGSSPMSLQRDLANWRAFARSWTPKLRGSPGICGTCASSRFAIAAGVTADDPHEIVHALVSVMVDRAARMSAQYERDYALESDPADYRAESATRYADRQLTFGLHAEAQLCRSVEGHRAAIREFLDSEIEAKVRSFAEATVSDVDSWLP
jgi:hypothetical protein